MQIDWVTVAAQIINFLVLVYLLKRFLYAPIVNAMDRRQHDIAATLSDAQHKAETAVHEAERYRQLGAELEQQKETLLDQARQEVALQREQLLEQARAEVAQTRGQWLSEIERDQELYRKTVRQAIARQVCSISRRALGELADAELEQQMTHAFLQQLQTLAADELAQLREAAARTGGVQMHSSFAIPPLQQQELAHTLHAQLGEATMVDFVTDAALLCGLELRAQGYKIGWNIDAFLSGVEQGLLQALPGGRES